MKIGGAVKENEKMDDLISRQAAIDEAYAVIVDDAVYDVVQVETLEGLPTADAVEVVRCKNCRYWQDNNNGYPHEECRWGHDETPDADDYCSYGERKEQ